MDPVIGAVSVLLVPVLAEGLKMIFKVDPNAKGTMKMLAVGLTALAAVLNAAADQNVPGLTEMVLGGVAMFFAQDGLYNTVFKPLFKKMRGDNAQEV